MRDKQEEKEEERVYRSRYGWVWRTGELSHALPLLSSSISLILRGFTDGRTNGQTWFRRHLCSRNRIRLVPPTTAHEMDMDSAFKAQVVNIFGADSKFEAWLTKVKIWTAEDFAVTCSEERLVDDIVKPAAADGVPREIKDKVNVKKLWKACRKDDDTVAASGLSDLTEFDKGLPERRRKSCEQLFLNKHGYALPPGRRLVGTQAGPIHSGSHNMPPDPKDFSLLPVWRMKLEGGSVGAVSNDSEMSIHTIYLKIRAFLYTAVFVNMDQPEWFDLAAAEALIDRIMNFLHHRHSTGRPPISFYTYAWESTARAFQLGIRSGKTLKELASQESIYQHFWTQYVPNTSRTERARAEKSPQRGGSGKARGKEGGRDRARDEGDKVAKIQRTKDREIASLKRQLSEVKDNSTSDNSKSSGENKKQHLGRWN